MKGRLGFSKTESWRPAIRVMPTLDYSAAVVEAVACRLEGCGLSRKGIIAASKSGTDRTLSGRVKALQVWLHDQRHSTCELPGYDRSWSSTPLRGKLPEEWSGEWRAFHDTFVVPALTKQARGAKRTKAGATGEVSVADIESLLEEDALGGPPLIDGDLVVNGKLYAHAVYTSGADNAELYRKANPAESLLASQVRTRAPIPALPVVCLAARHPTSSPPPRWLGSIPALPFRRIPRARSTLASSAGALASVAM